MLGDVTGSVGLLALEVCCEQQQQMKPVSSVTMTFSILSHWNRVQLLQLLTFSYLPVLALKRKAA